MMARFLLITLAAFLIALAGLAWWLDRVPAEHLPTVAPTAVEASAGAIYAAHFADIDGREQMLGQWQDKLLVLNFWATWCGPCREEMPLLSKLQSEYGPAGIQIVGIAADSRQNVSNFIKQSPVSYPLLTDEAMAMAFAKRLGNRLGLLPYTLVLRPPGEVILTRLGVVTESEMRDLIEKNIKK